MNETRDLIIGIDFGEKYSQICYFDRKAEEARSLPVKVGSSQYETPTCLCRREEQDDYSIGLEAEYFAREKGGILLDDLYRISRSREAIQVAGEEKEPWKLLAYFIREMLKFLGIQEIIRNTKCLTITMETLDEVQVENLQKACSFLGLAPERFMLMDYEESFYYYVMTQKTETWNRSVGWYSFAGNHVTFRKLTINSGSKPYLVRLENRTETDLREKPEERDEDFAGFIKETLGEDLYSSIQMNGEGFDQEWAQRSVKILCYQRRKVFFGNNLFAAGACGAGAEKYVLHKLKEYRYMSSSMVLTDVGMDMRVMGAPAYYPLIEAGSNWYECRATCELILDDAEELVFVVENMGGQNNKTVCISSVYFPGSVSDHSKRSGIWRDVSLQWQSMDRNSTLVKEKADEWIYFMPDKKSRNSLLY